MGRFDDIQVKILEHNLEDNYPMFLGMLTQRGKEIHTMDDLEQLYNKAKTKQLKEDMVRLCKSHSTIMRMNFVTVAIVGLSTKCLTQLRTHAKRVTCISTSTQYSEYANRPNNYVTPTDDPTLITKMNAIYAEIDKKYAELIKEGYDKDIVGYLLPQGLRKTFIMCANIDDWCYILRTRMCRRNTDECAHVARLIYDAIAAIDKVWVENALPACATGRCTEGKMCCKKPFQKSEFGYSYYENQIPEVSL